MNNRKTVVSLIKHLVYKIVLPVYLWSIGYRTLEDYLSDVEKLETTKTKGRPKR